MLYYKTPTRTNNLATVSRTLTRLFSLSCAVRLGSGSFCLVQVEWGKKKRKNTDEPVRISSRPSPANAALIFGGGATVTPADYQTKVIGIRKC